MGDSPSTVTLTTDCRILYIVHMKNVTASEARKHWFRLLDEALRGEVIAVQRKGHRLVLRREEVANSRNAKGARQYKRLLHVPDASPISFLEIQFLAEVGRLSVRNPEFTNTMANDTRFMVDDIPLASIVRHALRLDWTRDPFDRLLVAHSSARRVPFCTTATRKGAKSAKE